MKLIFMGSGGFAVPCLKALIESSHEILDVVCQPDKPAGRGLKLTACPVALAAREEGLGLFQPASLKNAEAYQHMAALNPDLIVVVAYGKILPKNILDLSPRGCVNVHASLLPKYRGAAPINWAIVNGETKTGVTTMFINEKMDEGDLLLSCEIPIDELDTAPQLEGRLEILGADLLLHTLKGVEAGTIPRTPQDGELATYAPIIKKIDGLIDWTKSAREIGRRVRGFLPWPVAFTSLDGKMLKIYEAHVSDEKCDVAPGTVINAHKYLSVATGKGVLYILEAQLEGKKRMVSEALLCGHKINAGTRLG